MIARAVGRLRRTTRGEGRRAVGLGVLSRVWAGGAGLVSVALVARRLSPTEQGFYYTMASLLAAQVFAELGLSYVVLQQSARESAFLQRSAEGLLVGDSSAVARVGSLARFATAWTAVAAVVFATAALPLGAVTLGRGDPPAGVMTAWVAAVLGATGGLALLGPTAVLEGLGAVADVAAIRLGQAVAGSVVVWTALLAGEGLLGPAAQAWASVCVTLVAGVCVHRRLARQLWTAGRGARVPWLRRLLPFQWRMALSWISGYAASQALVPALFASQGPVAAGRFGLSFTVATTLGAIALVWVSARAPRFGRLAALGHIDELDREFRRVVRRALGMYAAGAGLVLAAAAALHASGSDLAGRVMELPPLAALVGGMAAAVGTTALATYVRSFGEEPFLPVSLATGAVCITLSPALARVYGESGLAVGYALAQGAVGLGIGYAVYRGRRRAHHAAARVVAACG